MRKLGFIDKSGEDLGKISLIILTILFGLVMVSSIVANMLIYSKVSNNIEIDRGNRLGITYIETKLRSFDHKNGIIVKDFNGVDAIYLGQSIDELDYYTILYVYEGYLREIFCEKGSEEYLDLDAGENIVKADSLNIITVSEHEWLIEYVNSNHIKQELDFVARSGSYERK